jgi:Tol biopolymer transport system component
VWSPDGERIVFASSRKGRFDIYVKSFGGSGAEELAFESQVDKFTDSWSRDGRFFAFVAADPKTLFDIWVLPIEEDGEPTAFLQTEFVEVNPRFSPDGRWILYQSNESGSFEVYVAPFPGPGRKWQISLAGGLDPKWRSDGREIFYLSPDSKMMAVEVEYGAGDFRIGGGQALFDLSSSADYDVTRDGQKFIATVGLEGPEAPPLSLVHNWTAELKK